MFGRSFRLFDLLGIPIKVDLSWFLIAILIVWSLAGSVFPQTYPGLSATTYFLMGLTGLAVLATSIVLHELCHCVVARAYDVPIRGITLFLFGGVAEMGEEPPTARSEFFVAIAGPVGSAVLMSTGLVALWIAWASGWPDPVRGVAWYVAWLNGLLAGFNLIPAFPLDGGRVLRAVLWWWKGRIRWATRISSSIGAAFGVALIVLGFLAIVGGDPIAGFWWILLGFFLRGASQMSYQQLLTRKALEGEPVRRFMRGDPISVPPSTTIEELVENYVYQYHHKTFPVAQNGSVLGSVSIDQIREVPIERRGQVTVGEVCVPASPDTTIGPEDDATRALSVMSRTGSSRLLVVDGGRLVGILSLRDLLAFLSLKVELET